MLRLSEDWARVSRVGGRADAGHGWSARELSVARLGCARGAGCRGSAGQAGAQVPDVGVGVGCGCGAGAACGARGVRWAKEEKRKREEEEVGQSRGS